jgi:hypothetical protein
MSNKILIRNITSLTDARYFAAMQVDWISMRLNDDQSTFNRWHTFREWISGVRLAAEVKTDDESLIAKSIIDANPDGIITDDIGIIHLTGGITLFITSEKMIPGWKDNLFTQILPLKTYDNDLVMPEHFADHIYLEATWTPDLITRVKDSGYNGGFAFSDTEQAVDAMKDYSAMDALIESIRQ